MCRRALGEVVAIIPAPVQYTNEAGEPCFMIIQRQLRQRFICGYGDPYPGPFEPVSEDDQGRWFTPVPQST